MSSYLLAVIHIHTSPTMPSIPKKSVLCDNGLMRICYILLSPTFGMHQYSADIANRMGQTHEVHLITSKHLPRDRYAPYISIHPALDSHNTGLSGQSLKLHQLRPIFDLIVDLEPDVVHLTGPHLWHVPLLYFLRRKGIPFIHTIHDLEPHAGRQFGQLLYLWNRAILRLAPAILVHGKRYQEALQQSNRTQAHIFYTPLLHLFLNYENSLDLPATLPSPTDKIPTALFFGRLEHYKGIDCLLTAFEQWMAKASSIRGKLIIAGKGDLPTHWQDNLPPHIELRNRLIEDEEAIALFQQCDVVLLPYIDATQSALIAAAYFFGKPVIVSQTGALAEYVVDNQTGWIVPANNPATLAKVLQQAFAQPQALRKMGEAGRTWYDLQRAQELKTLISIYQTLASSLYL